MRLELSSFDASEVSHEVAGLLGIHNTTQAGGECEIFGVFWLTESVVKADHDDGTSL